MAALALADAAALMLQWQPRQLLTLQALGLKRFLRREDLRRPAMPPPERFLVEEMPPPVAAPSAAAAPIALAAGQIFCDERCTLVQHEALHFDWLFPALAGFADDLRILQREDEALLLRALRLSHWAQEADGLASIFAQPLPPPQGQGTPPWNSRKPLLMLGVVKVDAPAHRQLHHPAHLQQYPHKKRFWWQQLLTLPRPS